MSKGVSTTDSRRSLPNHRGRAARTPQESPQLLVSNKFDLADSKGSDLTSIDWLFARIAEMISRSCERDFQLSGIYRLRRWHAAILCAGLFGIQGALSPSAPVFFATCIV